MAGMTGESQAKTVVALLRERFLQVGSFKSAAHKKEPSGSGPTGSFQLTAWSETAAFTGLKVQAVGYERGIDKPAVVIYAAAGSKRDLEGVPSEIAGVTVKVKKIGDVKLRPELASGSHSQSNIFRRKGRIACGGSCGPSAEGDLAGTLGAIVKKRNGDLHVLSNNHVLAAANHCTLHMPIISPASCDTGPQYPPVTFARLASIEPLRSGDPKLMDACKADVAIAEVTNAEQLTSWQGDDSGYDTPVSTAEPISGMQVKKVGRTTGLTTGLVDAFAEDPQPVVCQNRHFKGTVWFAEVWYVLGDQGQFAIHGDSGSLVVTADGQHAVGLLFSSNKSGTFGMMFPIANILKLFGGISLVNGHGV